MSAQVSFPSSFPPVPSHRLIISRILYRAGVNMMDVFSIVWIFLAFGISLLGMMDEFDLIRVESLDVY